ncbi:MAG: histone deacetylase family protein [Gaiellaceae bacterium]
MEAFAHDVYTYPLPEGHKFPLAKYRRVREEVERSSAISVFPSRAASDLEISLAHEDGYVARVEAGELVRREELALGLPWSPELVERARRSVGATIMATTSALHNGTAANLGGGTHHAFPDSGRGFCVYNDVVVAVRAARRMHQLERALIVDLDVHQGDGTHFAFADDDATFTFSINGFGNYPFQRVDADLELDLPNGTGDERYLAELSRLLPIAVSRSRPDACFYLAGADPFEHDRLGRLALTKQGLARRDELVRDELERAGIPTILTLAGGYAERIEDTVEINLASLHAFTPD